MDLFVLLSDIWILSNLLGIDALFKISSQVICRIHNIFITLAISQRPSYYMYATQLYLKLRPEKLFYGDGNPCEIFESPKSTKEPH